MPCYSPIRAVLSCSSGGGRSISFNRSTPGQGVSLPCGSCFGCKLERARQWAVRVVHESKMHDENSFITLTYDEQHLPAGRCSCVRPHSAGSVCVDDFQKFLKRLRERLSPRRIRFFACGEYGEKLGRPHYHAILFGWFPQDAVCVKRSGDMSLFTSSLLSSAWGLGHTSVGLVSMDSASYVANYASKQVKTNREDEACRLAGRSREFLIMSRRPGIGRRWIDTYEDDVFPSDEVIVRGRSTRPPRYYDTVVGERRPLLLAGVKIRREKSAAALEDFMLASGSVVQVAPGNNARRLAVREKVARAKAALKSRTLE
nr:MAG: replication initiator protein [Microvirus sp.]